MTAKLQSLRMYHSQPLKSKSNPFLECSLPGKKFWGTETKSEGIDICQESTSGESFPYRFQLEEDVKRLQLQLQEEIELHTFLESLMEKDPWELSSSCSVPHPAQELLSNIATLETAVTKLEQEMMSLNFQLSQERNERRLAEYHSSHSASPPNSSSSLSILNHSHQSAEDSPRHDQTVQHQESSYESSQADSAIEQWQIIVYRRIIHNLRLSLSIRVSHNKMLLTVGYVGIRVICLSEILIRRSGDRQFGKTRKNEREH